MYFAPDGEDIQGQQASAAAAAPATLTSFLAMFTYGTGKVGLRTTAGVLMA
jgi:hypothetical protein